MSGDLHLDPQVIWAGKPGLRARWSDIWDPDRTSFDVDIVSLHIHERVSTRAILEAIRRPEPQLSLFGETTLPADQQIEFYLHDVNWANRLILGDSMLVMNSLLAKEGMASKVQMIYVDPPYGISYASNFQPRVDRREVKDKDEDLTHEPEQIKAYRDTWKLGIHSYLTYLRDRFLLCRELLADSGSVFVQINDENLHLVRSVLDEVFGRENICGIITFVKMSPLGGELLPAVSDYLLWYARDRGNMKYRQLFLEKRPGELGATRYTGVELADGTRLPAGEYGGDLADVRLFTDSDMSAMFTTPHLALPFVFEGREFRPSPGRQWQTTQDGLRRLSESGRLMVQRNRLRMVRYLDDYPVNPLSNLWQDIGGIQSRTDPKVYAVQTSTTVLQRCILMTTDPGDLVFDPTCGSGTAALVAEKWGRRWITCDTSRVAIAIARQRLMTARYDYYELSDPDRGVSGGFVYETAAHVKLESIAKNTEIDDVVTKYRPQMDDALADLNRAARKRWKEWEVPRDLEAGGSRGAREAHRRFWGLKRQQRQEIDASIRRNASQEVLYDRPRVKRRIVRVSGPFTVEAIPVPAIEDPSRSPIPQLEQTEAQAHRR
jgi:adenine-specific DNA-methyltransferase